MIVNCFKALDPLTDEIINHISGCERRQLFSPCIWFLFRTLLHNTVTSAVLRAVDPEVPSWTWRSSPACSPACHLLLCSRWLVGRSSCVDTTAVRGYHALCIGCLSRPTIQKLLPVTDGKVKAIPCCETFGFIINVSWFVYLIHLVSNWKPKSQSWKWHCDLSQHQDWSALLRTLPAVVSQKLC